MVMTIRPSADARVLAAQYLEARRQFDGAPATDKILQGTLAARRLVWALQLAEEIAPLLAADHEPSFRAVFRPSRPAPFRPDEADPRETPARIAAQEALHRQAGVGVIEPPRHVDTVPAPEAEDEPSIGDEPLFIGGAA